MSLPTEYKLSARLVCQIEKAGLSLQQLRLLHACLAYVDRQHQLQIMVLSQEHGRNCIASKTELATITGSPGQKSATWIEEAVASGGLNRFFRHLEMTDRDRLLSFRFQRAVGDACIANDADQFVILNTDEIAKISSAGELHFYTRAVMCARADHMTFALPMGDTSWDARTKKMWLRIAARVSKRLGQEYLLVPKRDAVTRQITKMIVKVSSQTTKWTAGLLYPRLPCPPVSIAHGGKFHCLSMPDLKARHAWTRVTRP